MEDIIIGMLDAVMDLGTLDASSLMFGSGRPAAMNILRPIWNYLALVGIGLSLIYFLLEMNQKLALEGRDLNLKSFFSPFLKLMVSIAVLANGSTIVSMLLSLNDNFISAANNALITNPAGAYDNGGQSAIDGMKQIIEDGGLLFQLGILVPVFGMYVISMVLCLVWWFKALTYKIEVLFRVSITPLGLCDVYSGQNSNAIRYLKGFLVLGVYAGSMILLPRISTMLAVEAFADASEAIKNGSLTGIWDLIKALLQVMFVAPFAALSCANLARTAAKEALGA